MDRPRLIRACFAAAVLVLGTSCGNTLAPPAPETLDHHVEVDLSQTWSSTPWNPERDSRGVPLPQPEQTTLTSQFVLPADMVGHGSMLVLEGLSWTAEVIVNGHKLEAVRGGPSPVEIPLGRHLRPGENIIKISVAGPQDTPTLLVGHTETAAMIATPPRLVLRPEQGLTRATATLSDDGVDLVALTRGETDGWSVQFSAWRDGERIADWGTAVISDGRAELQDLAWAGPSWPEDGALFLLQATIRNAAGQVVDSGAWRTGLRRFVLRDGQTHLNGQPYPLLGLRKHNAGLEFGLRFLGRAGLNLAEFHGEVPTSRELSMADELGVALAVLPRCDGRLKTDRDAVLAAGTELARQDAAMIAHVSHAPSVLLWSTEGSAINRDGYSVGRPLIKNMRTDPIERLVAAWDIPAFAIPSTGPDESLDERRERAGLAAGSPFWILEIHLEGDDLSNEAIAAAVQASTAVGAVGGVLPGAVERDAGWGPFWAATAPTIGVRPLALEGRRAHARITGQGLRPGEFLSVQTPGGPHRAAVAGPDGTATVSVWHAGTATARMTSGERDISLRPGSWSDATWRGQPTLVSATP